MKLLLIGSGGREHALAWKLSQSPRVREVVAAPGNAGMSDVARTVAGGIGTRQLLALAHREAPDLIVIGPEAPLVEGTADELTAAGFRVFGPSQAAARLEGSKAFAKEFMVRHSVPTAAYRTFSDRESALAYLRERGDPVVIKDSALAAGKGVTVAPSRAEAEAAIERIFAQGEGSQGTGGGARATGPGSPEVPARREVVIEELLLGQELSYLVFTDGHTFRPMPLAQDYKQALDGDRGPMTGGMGAVAPAMLLDAASRQQVETEIVERTLTGLRSDGIDYRGVLYFGLMLTEEGPRLLEYNVRMGDPETQVVMPLLADDLVDVLEAVIDRRLEQCQPRWHGSAAACVVMAAPGYPGEYRKGVPIGPMQPQEDVLVFHAGTGRSGTGLVSSGGRVLNVVGLAATVNEAVARAYRTVETLPFPGAHYRRDIGSRLDS